MPFSKTALLTLLIAAARAQSGHWEGAVQTPQGELNIIVDLTRNAGAWVGTIAVPARNIKSLALTEIAVQDSKVSFTVKGAPGHQTFQGAATAQTLSGTFTAGGQSLDCKLTRTGDARYEAPPRSTAIGKEVEGDWEGALDANGNTYRLKLHLANDADGAAGYVISVDQGGGQIPISTITQKEAILTLDLPVIGGTYVGTIAAGAREISGNWTQGPGTFPLSFRRPAK